VLIGDDTRVLDFGCGYARVMEILHQSGYTSLAGVDMSSEMMKRGRALLPHLALRVLTAPSLPFPDDTFDAALLFAVLTCIPSDKAQRDVVSELRRVLRPGGILYISDFLLQSDAKNQGRYREYAAKYGAYGVFETADGGVFRHHEVAWIDGLLDGFEVVRTTEFRVTTMDHHQAAAFQIFARKL
jgi:SAM-dependent methyltransferase